MRITKTCNYEDIGTILGDTTILGTRVTEK